MFYKFRYVFLIIKIFPIFLFSACFTPTVDHNQARMQNYYDEKRTFICGNERSAVITTEFFSSDNCLVELKLDEFDSPITTMVPIKIVSPYTTPVKTNNSKWKTVLFVILAVLVLAIVVWAVKQITIDSTTTNMVSYISK